MVKAFCGTTRITEISESRFQQILTERQLADEAAVAQAAEAEKEAAEEEEEDEDEDGANGGNDDHHPNDDDMHEGGGAMIIPSSESEGEHSGAESLEAAPEGEAPSPASSAGSGNQELAIVPFINPVANPSRTELFITPELAEILAAPAPVRVLEVTGGTEVELEAPVPMAEPSVTETDDSMLQEVSVTDEVELPVVLRIMETEPETELPRTEEPISVSESEIDRTTEEITMMGIGSSNKGKGKVGETEPDARSTVLTRPLLPICHQCFRKP